MTPLVSLSVHTGLRGAFAHGVVLLTVLAVGWALRVWRRQLEVREMMQLVALHAWQGRREPEPAREEPARRGTFRPAPAAPRSSLEGADAGDAALSVLVVASADTQKRILSEIEEMGQQLSVADSAWSARAACRDAIEAGRPYNLVLLDATLAGRVEADGTSGLEEDLQAWGARVAVVRARPPRPEEGIRSHESPDCRGRAGVTADPGTDTATLGLRGSGRH